MLTYPSFIIEYATILPLPETAQKKWNVCLFPRGSDGISKPTYPTEPLIFTIPDTPAKTVSGPSAPATETSYKELLASFLRKHLPKGTTLLEPMDKEFASTIVQSHRKSDVAYHIKAFRGSKDGYLFLLSTGIVWGFKKPLAFFAFENVRSISYTSILQRTFNLNITTNAVEGEEEGQEFEFSMIDQVDFAGIDGYIKKHGLQDASLAEGRKAKRVNVNGKKGAAAEDEADNGNGVGELAKAIGELEDEEDEDEEDYDPGSGGESEGSGSGDSDDDDEDDEDGEGGEGEDEDEEMGEAGEEEDEGPPEGYEELEHHEE
jgi:Histone chaperone Rttp106-like